MNGMWTLGVSCLSGLLFLSYKNQEKSLINFFQLDNYRNAIRQNYFCSHGGFWRQNHLLPGSEGQTAIKGRKEGLDRDQGKDTVCLGCGCPLSANTSPKLQVSAGPWRSQAQGKGGGRDSLLYIRRERASDLCCVQGLLGRRCSMSQ